MDHLPYSGSKASLLTLHGKERVIAPELFSGAACEVIHVSGYDTDQLGSFSREIPRAGSQLEAARKKARIGMELSGLPIGLANEGAFDVDPFARLFPWNYEVVILIDDVRQIEIIGQSSGQAQSFSQSVASWDELETCLAKAQFPSHHLMLRPDNQDHSNCQKGISDMSALRAAFDWAMSLSSNGSVFIENDLRAHANPTRMNNIRLATQDLVSKMNTLCPQCAKPGYGVTALKKGLPCELCLTPTSMVTAKVWSCQVCEHQEESLIPDQKFADPSKCPFCNP